MEEKVKLRRAVEDDAANLVVLKQQVWVATYAVDGIRSEFSEYLLGEFTLAHEIKSLEDPEKMTLVAERNGHLIACAVVVLQARLSIPEYKILPEISVLYVLERFTGKGVGQLLMNHVVDVLKELGHDTVFLTVYHKNLRALEFYRHYGFIEAGHTYFEMGENSYENRVLIFSAND
ncbi:MAG: GNAT family N-acetyltransferase [Bacteroidales bacterium]